MALIFTTMANPKNTSRKPIELKKYIFAFVITCIIFIIILYVNNILDQKKIADVKSIQDRIALDLLSSETQFNLLSETSCKNISSTALSPELNSLAAKLSYMESNDSGAPSAELIYLKKYYSLLEIKDFLLMKQIGQKCTNISPIAILYFYGNKSDCSECENMGFVLTYLREQYPDLRIYSFDYNLDLAAVNTLKSVYNISGTRLPAIVVNDETYVGFRDIDGVKKLIPALLKIDKARAASSTANKVNTKASTSTNSTVR